LWKNGFMWRGIMIASCNSPMTLTVMCLWIICFVSWNDNMVMIALCNFPWSKDHSSIVLQFPFWDWCVCWMICFLSFLLYFAVCLSGSLADGNCINYLTCVWVDFFKKNYIYRCFCEKNNPKRNLKSPWIYLIK
jgi:hypothetical protein